MVICSSAPSWRSAPGRPIGSGFSNMCLVSTAMNVSASNGTRPVNISYMMTPSA